MKGTEHFKQTIKAFLDNKAANDELFAQSYNKPHKNLDVRYHVLIGYKEPDVVVFQTVGNDADITLMKTISTLGKEIQCNVVVNHHVELTDEEKGLKPDRKPSVSIGKRKFRR